MVTWSTWTPRSASSSSTSRYDSAKRSYQRTASTITSGGAQQPANADRKTAAERGRRVLLTTVCLLPTRSQQLQQRPMATWKGPWPPMSVQRYPVERFHALVEFLPARHASGDRQGVATL